MVSLRSITVAGFLAAASLVAAGTQTTASGLQVPTQVPTLGTDTVHGCYSSAGELVMNSTIKFNTQGECTIVCRGMNKPVGASTGGNICYCGDKYPPKSTLVEDSKCSIPCPGWGYDACGGIDTFTVYNTGLVLAVQDSSSDDKASTTGTSGSSPTSVAPSIVTVSASSSATASSEPQPKGPSTVGIAVGVVVGLLAVAGIIGGIFFFMRSRRNREIEEEHRRNAAVNAFISGSKPPGSSGGTSMTDSRLDPVMANRRLSTGSIADNEDYSRRILRVTNA